MPVHRNGFSRNSLLGSFTWSLLTLCGFVWDRTTTTAGTLLGRQHAFLRSELTGFGVLRLPGILYRRYRSYLGNIQSCHHPCEEIGPDDITSQPDRHHTFLTRKDHHLKTALVPLVAFVMVMGEVLSVTPGLLLCAYISELVNKHLYPCGFSDVHFSANC